MNVAGIDRAVFRDDAVLPPADPLAMPDQHWSRPVLDPNAPPNPTDPGRTARRFFVLFGALLYSAIALVFIAIVLARLVGAAVDYVVDAGPVDIGVAFHQGSNRQRGWPSATGRGCRGRQLSPPGAGDYC